MFGSAAGKKNSRPSQPSQPLLILNVCPAFVFLEKEDKKRTLKELILVKLHTEKFFEKDLLITLVLVPDYYSTVHFLSLLWFATTMPGANEKKEFSLCELDCMCVCVKCVI